MQTGQKEKYLRFKNGLGNKASSTSGVLEITLALILGYSSLVLSLSTGVIKYSTTGLVLLSTCQIILSALLNCLVFSSELFGNDLTIII